MTKNESDIMTNLENRIGEQFAEIAIWAFRQICCNKNDKETGKDETFDTFMIDLTTIETLTWEQSWKRNYWGSNFKTMSGGENFQEKSGKKELHKKVNWNTRYIS